MNSFYVSCGNNAYSGLTPFRKVVVEEIVPKKKKAGHLSAVFIKKKIDGKLTKGIAFQCTQH
jgi:hypothetical protein